MNRLPRGEMKRLNKAFRELHKMGWNMVCGDGTVSIASFHKRVLGQQHLQWIRVYVLSSQCHMGRKVEWFINGSKRGSWREVRTHLMKYNFECPD